MGSREEKLDAIGFTTLLPASWAAKPSTQPRLREHRAALTTHVATAAVVPCQDVVDVANAWAAVTTVLGSGRARVGTRAT